jgi:hypothetical protein
MKREFKPAFQLVFARLMASTNCRRFELWMLALSESQMYTLGGSFFALSTVQHDDGKAPHLHQVQTPF